MNKVLDGNCSSKALAGSDPEAFSALFLHQGLENLLDVQEEEMHVRMHPMRCGLCSPMRWAAYGPGFRDRLCRFVTSTHSHHEIGFITLANGCLFVGEY